MAKIKVYKAMVDGKEQVFTVKPEGETTFLSDFPEAKFIEEIDNDSVDGPGDGPGDGDPTVKTEAETKKDDAEVSAPKGFQTDAATSADVVSETTPAQNTESSLEDTSSVTEVEIEADAQPTFGFDNLDKNKGRTIIKKERTTVGETKPRYFWPTDGSSNPFYEKKYLKDFAGKTIDDVVYPDSFDEYVKSKGKKVLTHGGSDIEEIDTSITTDFSDWSTVATSATEIARFIKEDLPTLRSEEDKAAAQADVTLAKVVAKDFLTRGIFQEKPVTTFGIDFTGKTEPIIPNTGSIENMNAEGKVTDLLEDKITKAMEGRTGTNAFLDGSEIRAIAVTIVQDKIKEEQQEKANKRDEIVSIAQANGTYDLQSKVAVQDVVEKLPPAKKKLAIVNQKIFGFGKITLDAVDDQPFEYWAQQAQEKTDLQTQAKELLKEIDSNYTPLYDYAGVPIDVSQSIVSNLTNTPAIDFNPEVDAIKISLPTDREKLKAEFTYNSYELTNLNRLLDEDITVRDIRPGSSTLNETVVKKKKDLAFLRATGTNLEETFEIVKPNNIASEVNDLTKGDIKELISNSEYDTYNAQQLSLNLTNNALVDVFLLNIDPGSIPTSVPTNFLKAMTDRVFGNYLNTEMFGNLNQDKLTELEGIWNSNSLFTTDQQVKNFEIGVPMHVAKGVGNFLPEIPAWILASFLSGGFLAWARVTSSLAKWGQSAKFLDKIKFTLTKGLIEEAKFTFVDEVLDRDSDALTGMGFGIGASTFGLFLPKQARIFRGSLAPFSNIIRNILSAPGGVIGSQGGVLLSTFKNAILENKVFTEEFKKHYSVDEFGQDIDFQKNMYTELLTFFFIGLTGIKARDFNKISTVRRNVETIRAQLVKNEVVQRTKDQYTELLKTNPNISPDLQLEQPLSEAKVERLVELYNNQKAIVDLMDYEYNKMDIATLRKNVNIAIDYVNTPEQRRDDPQFSDIKSEKQANDIIQKYESAVSQTEKRINKSFDDIKIAVKNVFGIEVKFNLDKKSESTEAGSWNEKNNTINLNLQNLSLGILEHEVGHIALDLLAQKYPTIAQSLKENVKDAVNSALKGRTYRDSSGKMVPFEEFIKDRHKDKPKEKQDQEYLLYIAQFLNKKEYKESLLGTGVIGSIKQGIQKTLDLISGKTGKMVGWNLGKNGIQRGDDILRFLHKVGQGGKSVKGWENLFKEWQHVAAKMDKNGKITQYNVNSGAETVKLPSNSNKVIESTSEISDGVDNWYNNNKDKKGFLNEAMIATAMYQDPVNRIVSRQLKNVPSANSGNISDITMQAIYFELPALVESYHAGQLFIREIREKGLTSEQARIEANKRQMGRFNVENLISRALGTLPEASLSSYINGQLANKINGIYKMPQFQNIMFEISVDAVVGEGKKTAYDTVTAESTGIPGDNLEGSVDLSTGKQRSTVEKVVDNLNLNPKVTEAITAEVNNVIENVPLKNLGVNYTGPVEIPFSGIYILTGLPKNEIKIEYPNKSVKIIKNGRSPQVAVTRILKELVSQQLTIKNDPNNTPAERIEAERLYEEYEELLKTPPKITKQDLFSRKLQKSIEDESNTAFKEFDISVGSLSSATYKSFITAAYSSKDNFLTDTTYTKRFNDLIENVFITELVNGKEVVKLDSQGRKTKARHSTAAGGYIFTKTIRDLQQWKDYFLPEGGVDIKVLEARRKSLIKSFIRELGTDILFDKTLDKEGQLFITSAQEKLGNKLEQAVFAAMQTELNRSGINKTKTKSKSGKSFSELVEEKSKALGKDTALILENYQKFINNYQDEVFLKLKKTDPDLHEVLTKVIKDYTINKLDSIDVTDINASKRGLGDSKVNGQKVTAVAPKDLTAQQLAKNEIINKTIIKTIEKVDKTQEAITKGVNDKPSKSLVLPNLMGYTGRITDGIRLDLNRFNEMMSRPGGELSKLNGRTDVFFEPSSELIKLISLAKTNAKEASKLDLNKDDNNTVVTKNINNARNIANRINLEPKEKGDTDLQSSLNKVKKFQKETKNNEAGVADLKYKKSVTTMMLKMYAELFNFAPQDSKIDVANAFGTFLLNNDGLGARSLSLDVYFSFSGTGPKLVKYTFRGEEKFKLDTNSNEHLLAKQKFALLAMNMLVSGELMSMDNINLLTGYYNSQYSRGSLQVIADRLVGSTTVLPTELKIAAGTGKDTQANRKSIEKMLRGTLDPLFFNKLATTVNYVTKKTALQEMIENAVNQQSKNLPTTKGAITNNNELLVALNLKSTTFSTGKQLSEIVIEGPPELSDGILEKEVQKMIFRKTKGAISFENDVSDSAAYNLGRKKGRYEFFLPPNAEDFHGLLYKLYGRGKQGEADMAFMKENVLRDYTRAENALSIYRMNLVVDLKALETSMKELGTNKAEVASVKRIKKLGYNIDQAVRVYIWERLGIEVPGIQKSEKAQLVGAVFNSPRLQAYAKGIMEITKTAEKYPNPSNNWFRSNIQYDLFNYATEGVRAKFLAPWQAKVDAIFTNQTFNKLEAGFGREYVKNLKGVLERMSKGKTRSDSNNKEFNKTLNYINGSVASIMFLNMRSAALQTISAANYINWTDNNPVAIGKVISKNPKLFVKTMVEIFNSDALKDRREGLKLNVEEAEMYKAINAGGRSGMQSIWDAMIRIGFKPTQMADSFAITMGGTPFYLNRTKTYESQGYEPAQAKARAWEDFLDVTQESQQSSQADRVSEIQVGLLGRAVFAFNNTPFQMARLQKKATLDLINNRGDIKTNASRLAYYAFIQSTLFYGLQQGFYSTFMREDDSSLSESEKIAKYADFEKRLDRIAKSVIQGTLTGSGLPGKIAVTTYNTIEQAIAQYKKGYAGKDFFPILNKAFSISPPLGSKVSRMGTNWNSLIFADFTKKGKSKSLIYDDLDPQNPNNRAYISMFGTATNIPLDRIVQKMENIQNMLDTQNASWERISMFFGTPKWTLQTSQENAADEKKLLDSYYEENTSEEQKNYDKIKASKKPEQERELYGYGLSSKQVRSLNTEEKRIEAIIKLRKEQKKKNSLK
tara:strand:+ start:8570 stop:17620 length:9051 start_codon:yes stop_codon:yes gene_type:complete